MTISRIADELGVTPTTVSNAFNRPDQLSPALRERVLETARRLGYPGPDAAARSMRRGRLPALGVLYADRLSNAFADQAFVAFLKGVSLAAEEAGCALMLIPGTAEAMSGAAGIALAVLDGFIIYSMADDDPQVRAVIGRRLPVVVADSPDITGVPRVGIDDEQAARQAAEHLLALGHRRFGILAGELGLDRRSGAADAVRQAAASYGVNRSRLRGYFAALAAAGIDPTTVPVEEVSDEIEHHAFAATAKLLTAARRPTALLAMSDRMALVALEAATHRGLAVPQDVSVIGFDDVPDAARAVPPLTTVHQPHVEKGRLAGMLLIGQLRGEHIESPQLLTTRLVVRGSTGSAP